ncbi:kinase-like domain-containing protein, partial [Phycomyces nitens]
LTPESFHIVRLLGRGSFGKVYQVIKRNTKQTYAMKVLSKRLLVAENEIAHTLSERNVLIGTFTNPFIVSLKFSFQTAEHLFLVMEYIPGGDLFEHLQKETIVSDQVARFFISEIICAFQDIHAKNVVYRDLKPENIMLDSLGHIALTDFGLCKELGQSQTTDTFCGTGEYLAPEMVLHKPYGQAVDWWSLGILLYELLVGRPPFQSVNRNTLYDRICRGKLSFPSHVSPQAKDLIRCLLERDPTRRLGAMGAEQVKAHPWFDAVQWNLVASKRVQPPTLLASKPPKPICIPTKKRDTQVPFLSLQDNSPLSPTIQSAFHGFSYVNDCHSLRSSIIS